MRQIRALLALLILGVMLLTATVFSHAESAVALPHTDDGWSMSADGTLRIESNAGWRNYVKNSYGLRPPGLLSALPLRSLCCRSTLTSRNITTRRSASSTRSG